MRRIAVIALLCVAAPVAAQGKDEPKEEPKDSPQAAVVKEMLGVMDSLTKALSGIKDAGTAEAAKPELRKLAKAWMTVRGKAEKVPPPSKEEKARLEKDFKSRMELAQRKLFVEAERVRGIAAARDVLEEIRSVLSKAMK
jgi:uncharacterized membrane protein (UPF0182 family)